MGDEFATVGLVGDLHFQQCRGFCLTDIGKTDNDAVVVEGKTAGGRNLKVLKELNKVATEAGVAVENLPKDVVDTADADAVVSYSSPEEFDTKVATKTESGAVVMKLKEVKETAEPKKTTKK